MKPALRSALASGLLAVACGASAEWRLNLQTPASDIGRAIYDLHTVILLVCAVIFVGTFGTMLYSIVKHRKSVGHKAAHFHENTMVELVWTVVPFLILFGMAYPATRTLIAQRDTSQPDLTIKVTGYQWKWHYDYLDEGIGFYSNLSTPLDQILGSAPKGEHYLLEVDEPMVVPVGKRVRLLVTAGDVLHAWFVPALAVKQDAIPGFVRDTWFKAERMGTFRGQCAELCGSEHAYMPIVVEVVSDDEYRAWLAARKPKAADTPAAQAAVPPPAGETASNARGAQDGKAIYEQSCQVCHAQGVAGAPRTGDKAAWGPRIAQGLAMMHEHAIKGIRAMPPKGGNSALSDAQVSAAVDYMVAQVK
jgi:cytochrome c oxidase subunit 2